MSQQQNVRYYNHDGATGLGYDAAGNLQGYYQVGADGKASTTRYVYEHKNGAWVQTQATTNGTSTATSYSWYDANGFLSNIEQSNVADQRFARAFVNDAQGNVLYVNQGANRTGRIQNQAGGYIGGWVGDGMNQGNIQHQMVVNGEVLARHGSAPDSETPVAQGAAPVYKSVAEFYAAASPMQLKGANLSPVSYTVAGGETLKDIARNVPGDASLWWRIAEANALALGGDTQLAVGQTLTVPKVALNANSADTLQPYEPGKVIGSQDPVLPAPAAKGGGCGGLGKIIMVVVAIVVTIYTAGALAAAGTLGSNALGAATLAGATTGGGLGATLAAGATVLGGGAGMGAAIAAGALAGAAGSIASQVVGNAIGAQDGFSWKSVGLAALSGAVSSGLAGSAAMASTDLGMTAARAATANALTQGIGVVTGLQKSFDWKGVAGAAAGAAVGWGLNEALGVTVGGERNLNANASNQSFFGMGAAGAVLRGTLSGLGAGTAAAVARGGKVAIQQVATDAFGNALAEVMVGQMQQASQQEGSLQNAREATAGSGLRLQKDAGDLPYRSKLGGSNWDMSTNYSLLGADETMRLPTQVGDRYSITVQAGDSTSAIAQREWGDDWRGGLAVLKALNPGLSSDAAGNPVIREGQSLWMTTPDQVDPSQRAALSRAGGNMIGTISRNEATLAQQAAVRAEQAAAARSANLYAISESEILDSARWLSGADSYTYSGAPRTPSSWSVVGGRNSVQHGVGEVGRPAQLRAT